MKIKLYLILALFISETSVAQSLRYDWSRRVGGLNDDEKLWSVASDAQGNVYTAGSFRGVFSDQGVSITSLGGEDIALVKYDSLGNLLWAKSAGGLNNDEARAIDVDDAGNVYITGAYSGLAVFDTVLVTNNDINQASLPYHFVARYNPQGQLDWVRSVEVEPSFGFYPYSTAYALKIDSDGDIVIAGEHYSPEVSPFDTSFSDMGMDGSFFRLCNLNYSYLFTQKLDTSGNTIWINSFGGNENRGVLLSVDFDPQSNIICGGFLEAGSSLSFGNVNAVNTSLLGTCALVYKLSPAGNPLRAFTVTSSQSALIEDLVVTPDGNYHFCGWNSGTLSGQNTSVGLDGFYMRTDTIGGNPIVKQLQGPGDDYFSGITWNDQRQEIGLCGYYLFQASFDGQALPLGTGNRSVLFVQDLQSNVLSSLQPVTLSGSTLTADIDCNAQGNYYLCGDITGSTVFFNDTIITASQDMYVSRIVPVISTGVDKPENAYKWTLYPNPASETMWLDAGDSPVTEISLFNLQGQQVFSKQGRFAGITPISLTGLAEGSYLVRIWDGNRYSCRRIVRQ
jgi:hypothetical protein